VTASSSGRPPDRPRVDYHNLTDDAGQPLAGLLIVLDSDGQPVRAELHVSDEFTRDERDEAVWQAHQLLRDRYSTADETRLPLYVLRMGLDQVAEVDIPAGAPASAVQSRGADVAAPAAASEPAPAAPAASFSRFLPLVAAILIGLGLLLIGWTVYEIVQGRSGAARVTATAAAGSGNDPGARQSAALAAAPTATATAVPTPEPTPELRNTYCMWPDDTLSEIALHAGVTVEELTALNPDFTGHAGATLQLPPGGIPPDRWDAPMPEVESIYDLPVGVSGYYIGYDNRAKRVALSFDIGYVEGNEEMIAMLADRGIEATFFVLGGAVENHPEMIAQILDSGHELGNHSYTHDNMLWMSNEQVREELDLTEAFTQAAYPGATTKPIFRAPFGAINGAIVNVANNAGYHVIGWTVDSRDWTEEINADELYRRVTDLVCPGAIIAFHDVNEANGPAIPRIIDFLVANGYEFVTVTEMLFP
jgi:peptidoglycan/xylan/chitin deacetylase (PgdA/CDA1 family)